MKEEYIFPRLKEFQIIEFTELQFLIIIFFFLIF